MGRGKERFKKYSPAFAFSAAVVVLSIAIIIATAPTISVSISLPAWEWCAADEKDKAAVCLRNWVNAVGSFFAVFVAVAAAIFSYQQKKAAERQVRLEAVPHLATRYKLAVQLLQLSVKLGNFLRQAHDLSEELLKNINDPEALTSVVWGSAATLRDVMSGADRAAEEVKELNPYDFVLSGLEMPHENIHQCAMICHTGLSSINEYLAVIIHVTERLENFRMDEVNKFKHNMQKDPYRILFRPNKMQQWDTETLKENYQQSVERLPSIVGELEVAVFLARETELQATNIMRDVRERQHKALA